MLTVGRADSVSSVDLHYNFIKRTTARRIIKSRLLLASLSEEKDMFYLCRRADLRDDLTGRLGQLSVVSADMMSLFYHL